MDTRVYVADRVDEITDNLCFAGFHIRIHFFNPLLGFRVNLGRYVALGADKFRLVFSVLFFSLWLVPGDEPEVSVKIT